MSFCLAPGGSFAFNLPSLFSFTNERAAFRATVNRILDRRGIERSSFWEIRERRDFPALLTGAGLEVTRDGSYLVAISPRQAKEWRRIPVFARRWGNFAGLPPDVSAEILEAVKRRALRGERNRRSRWRVVVGRKPSEESSSPVK